MATPEIPSTMRAWQYTAAKNGLEKSLKLNASAPLPADPAKLPANTALVKVFAASINPVDHKLPELPFPASLAIKTPAVPGHDFAGKVVATTVPTLKAGQWVFGHVNPPAQHGVCAEYTSVQSESNVIPLPEGLSEEQAACIGIAGLSAWQCIVPQLDAIDGRTNGEGVKGKRIFINGGSGGTGTFGLQIAKTLGAAKITTSCSTTNVDLCKSLGADEVIDYKNQDVAETLVAEVAGDFDGKGYDLVVDNVGTPDNLLKESAKFLKPSGKYAQLGTPSSLGGVTSLADRALRPGFLGGAKRKWQFVGKKSNRPDYEQIAGLMAQGKIKAAIEERYGFDKVPEAYATLKTGRVRGKIIIKVDDS